MIARDGAWLVALAAIGAAVVWIARIGAVESLAVDAYRDDAWYYFDFVRNLCEGSGPVVGDGPPTNGVQFLWAMLLAPLWWLGGSDGLEQGARWLGLSCLVLAGPLLARALRREGMPQALAVTGGLLLIGSPFLVTEAQNGQESGLVVLATTSLLALRASRAWVFTLVCVAATLARVELLFVATALASLRTEAWPRRAIGPAAALLGYAAVNLALAGHVMPDAGWPMAWLAHERFLSAEPGPWDWLRHLWWWGRPVALGGPFAVAGVLGSAALVALAAPRFVGRGVALASVLVLLAAAILGVDDLSVPLLATTVLVFRTDRFAPLVPVARAALLAGIALVALHDLVRWSPRDYYWVPISIVGAWATSHVIAALPRRAAVALLVAAVTVSIVHSLDAPRRFPWQAHMALAGEHLETCVPPGARIGSFNAGLIAFESQLKVVNLDGVVNHPAFEALKARRLLAYLDAEGIDWLCDDPIELNSGEELHARGRFFSADFDVDVDFIEAARFVDLGAVGDAGGWSDTLVLWRRAGTPAGAADPAFVDRGARAGGGRVIGWSDDSGRALWWRRGDGAAVLLVRPIPGVRHILALPASVDGTVIQVLASPRGDEAPRSPASLLLEYR